MQERDKAIDLALSQIEKQFGKGAIMRLGNDEPLPDIAAIPTGALSLDVALGVGGVPRGRVIEIFGPESSGKTTLALHIVAEAQKLGGIAAFIDAEHALDIGYARRLGVRTDDLLVSQPDTGEQALDITEMLVRSGAIDVLVIDSVAALVPKAEIEGDMGDSHMGLQARLMSQALRKLTGIISKSSCCVIFINQIRMKIGVMFGNPETTTGGNALKFYASVRMDIRKIAALKQGNDVIGSRTKVKVVKNKVAPPFREVEFDILYGEGISREGDLLDLAVEKGLIDKSGAWFSYGKERIGQGRENSRIFLKDRPEIAGEIETKLLAELGLTPGAGGGKGVTMELDEILTIAIKVKSSDIHIKAGLPPIVRIDGKLRPIPNAPRLAPDAVKAMAFALMNERQKKQFEENYEVDLSYGVPELGRFRINAFSQRGTVALVMRAISMQIPTLDSLNLPPILKKLSKEERGLILVTGTTGSGKSTTLASMIDYINENRTCNVITIEDPVEYLHRDKKSIISQREVGFDTPSFGIALKGALRQDPDVILVGEMRDLETIETAMNAAETGHLVMSTLHTLDAAETVNRIISVFPPYHQRQVRTQLSGIIKGVISQRLVPKADGKGRVPAVEIMIGTARIRECIDDKEKTKQIPEAIAQGVVSYGMQSFDQSLMQLYTKKLITYEEAMRQSTNPDDFALKVSGISSTSDSSWDEFAQEEETPADGDASFIEKF